MYKNKTILAIITARGGSKGLPQKNIKRLAGKPLIAWSIDQAKESKYIDKLIVSTDDEKIANVSKEYGAEVPFMRPESLASDTASSIDVLEHAIQFESDRGNNYDILVLLEPTSPLRETKDIDLALEKLIDHNEAQSIAGVCEVEGQHPDFIVKLEQDIMYPYINFNVKRRQDLSKLYFFEGSIYASYVDTFLNKRSFYHDKTLGYVVPKWKSFEVDDIVDFLIIERLMEAHQNKEIS